jgi:V/A-type H+-transporting ATPase subunit K
MKMKMLKNALKIMAVLMIATSIAGIATAEAGDDNEQTVAAWKGLGAGIALGGCGIGTGLGQGQIGAAAVGWVAEDSSKFGTAIIFTVLPETVVVLGLLPLFMG